MKIWKSGKQRKREIKAARTARAARGCAASTVLRLKRLPAEGFAAVDPLQLAHYESYGAPHFVKLGYYEDTEFRCIDCGAVGTWTAERQKWWYEVAKGNVETRAVRCKTCRATERARKEEARRVQQEGWQRKIASKLQRQAACS